MFKKLLIATAILATSSTVVFANGAPYLGGSIGIVDNSSHAIYRGVPVTAFGGYGTTLNQNIYLGGEVLATLGTATINNSSWNSNGLRSTYGYGASFIPGYYVNDNTMTYGRAGVVRTRFGNVNDTLTGGQFGFGMQTRLIQNWDLRTEYDYTKYESASGIHPRSDLFNVGLVYKIS